MLQGESEQRFWKLAVAVQLWWVEQEREGRRRTRRGRTGLSSLSLKIL
jgi:hypothetical protein